MALSLSDVIYLLVCGEMPITQRLVCGRDRNSLIAMRSDREPRIDLRLYRIARRVSGH